MRILRPTNTSNISAVRIATLLKTEIHMVRCRVLASQHAVIPPEVCYEIYFSLTCPCVLKKVAPSGVLWIDTSGLAEHL
jgi:hypothetical protein